MTDIVRTTATTIPIPIPAAVDPKRDMVAGGSSNWATQYARTLPQRVDDLAATLGADIYDRMQTDPAVSAALRTITVSILAHGYQLAPCEDEKRQDLAGEIAHFLGHTLDNLSIPFPDVLGDMLGAVAEGNRVAELVWADLRWNNQQRLTLSSIKVKPRNAVAFAVDPFMNVIGIMARVAGSPFPVHSGQILGLDPAKPPPNLLPRDKFAIWTHEPKNADPRGTSLLRAAYDWWWIKQQAIPEFLKYLSQFASPSLVGTTPENSGGGYGLPGAATPEQIMLESLLQFQNGSAAVFRHGSEVKPIQAQGGEEAYKTIFALCDAQITVAILLQLLATGTAAHQTNASTAEHANVLEDVISRVKQSLETMVERDILRPLVLNNWGPDALGLVPRFSLGQVEQQDLTPLITAIANLTRSGYVDESQKAALDVLLQLPQRAIIEEPVAPLPVTEKDTDDEESEEDEDETPTE